MIETDTDERRSIQFQWVDSRSRSCRSSVSFVVNLRYYYISTSLHAVTSDHIKHEHLQQQQKQPRIEKKKTDLQVLGPWQLLSRIEFDVHVVCRSFLYPWSVTGTGTIIRSDSHWKIFGKCVGSSIIADLILSLKPTPYFTSYQVSKTRHRKRC